MKLLSVRAGAVAVCLVLALVLGAVSSRGGQTNYYAANGSEYPIIGSLPGDQVFPTVALSPKGGFVVWQDNITDGSGWGISAERVDPTLSGTLQSFRVNMTGAGDQENPKVALLKNGGAAFVWQGGTEGYQHIFARFLTPTNTFLTTTDVPVSLFYATNTFQVNPAIAVLNDSNVVVVWQSFNQASSSSLLDVYAKILSPSGATVKSEFLVNQFTNFNQRTPSVAAVAGGGFVVTWVSEQERTLVSGNVNETEGTAPSAISLPSVDIYARLFQSNGVAATSEFLVNMGTSASANPNVAAGSDGGFMIAWSQRNLANLTNLWDVYARTFTGTGVGATNVVQLDTTSVYGSQFAPQLSAIGVDYLAVWTGIGVGGSREGIYGQFVHNDESLIGGELQVNTTTIGQPMQPTVASDGSEQFLVIWSRFTGLPNSFDLFAQRYINSSTVLLPMSAPYVWAPFVLSNNVYQPQLIVSWAPVAGLSVSNYEVFVDGSDLPTGIVTSNGWTMTAASGLATSSTHSFAVSYVTTSDNISPASPPTSGTTWSGANYDGIPFEWMEEYYGLSFSSWPSNVNAPLVPGGLSLSQVFSSGGDPLDPGTWLQQTLTKTYEGMFLSWNTQPGATYQVQVTTNFIGGWSNLGSPRFAAGTNDSINVGGSAAGYYRVNLLRQ